MEELLRGLYGSVWTQQYSVKGEGKRGKGTVEP
jgi:hypothetical protein